MKRAEARELARQSGLSVPDRTAAYLRRSVLTRPFEHLTASGWVVDPDHSSLLLVFHRRLRRWLQPGGHIRRRESATEAAIREVGEETGVQAELPPGLEPSGALVDVSCHRSGLHLHHDLRFALVPTATTPDPSPGSLEVSKVAWVSAAELANYGFGADEHRVATSAIAIVAQALRRTQEDPEC